MKQQKKTVRNQEIFDRYRSGESSQKILGAEYGISPSRVGQIVARFFYREVRRRYDQLTEPKYNDWYKLSNEVYKEIYPQKLLSGTDR